MIDTYLNCGNARALWQAGLLHHSLKRIDKSSEQDISEGPSLRS